MAFESRERGCTDAFVHIYESIREKMVRLGFRQPQPYRPKGHHWDVSPESSLTGSMPDMHHLSGSCAPRPHPAMVYPFPFHEGEGDTEPSVDIPVPKPVAVKNLYTMSNLQFITEPSDLRALQGLSHRHELPASDSANQNQQVSPVSTNIAHPPSLRPWQQPHDPRAIDWKALVLRSLSTAPPYRHI